MTTKRKKLWVLWGYNKVEHNINNIVHNIAMAQNEMRFGFCSFCMCACVT